MIQDYLKSVSPSEIGNEFEKIRRLSSQEKKEQAVRATLANVIFLLGEEESVTERIHKLAKNLPSRFFSIKLDDQLDTPLSVKIGSLSVENSSGQLIQTEEIHISVRPDVINRVPNLILSQLVPDIDVILIDSDFCGANPKQNQLKDLLLPIADIYLMKDVSEKVMSSLRHLESSNELDFSTRCWSIPLISKWCSLISEQFNSDYVLGSLKNLKSIDITCSAPKSSCDVIELIGTCYLNCLPTDVNLFLAWVQSSLKLKIFSYKKTSTNKVEIVCESTTNEYLSSLLTINIRLVNETVDSFAASLRRVIFNIGDAANTYQVDCNYLHSLDVFEISTGGNLKKEDSKNDVCEFNVRRIPTKHIDDTDAMLIAIRNQPINCNLKIV